MSHQIMVINLLTCSLYGLLSIFQTLNSRTLYKDLHFDFYSFTFALQRIAIILIFLLTSSTSITFSRIIKVIPFSACMCVSTILSSYCLTIMPLAGFLSFKKLIVLFIMGISCLLKLPVKTNNFQNLCVIGIVIGGIMVGQRDMLTGDPKGYIYCMLYNLSQAILLQYSAYLYRKDKFEPSELQFYHALVSLPYYIGTILVENQIPALSTYLTEQANSYFYFILIFCVFLAVTSEFFSNWISMKISPFQKSTVSNIKDLILMLISVYYYHDILITWISGIGIIVCMAASALFSIPFMEKQAIDDKILQKSTNWQTTALVQEIQANLDQQYIGIEEYGKVSDDETSNSI